MTYLTKNGSADSARGGVIMFVSGKVKFPNRKI